MPRESQVEGGLVRQVETVAGLVRELNQGVQGMNERQVELERRLSRLEPGSGYMPPNLSESGAVARAGVAGRAGVERGGFALWLQSLVEADPVRGGAIVPADAADEVFELVGAASVGLASGFRQVPTDSDELHIPVIADDSANWVSEATAIPTADPVFAEVVARPHKLASYVELSNELLLDSSPAAADVVSQSVMRAVGRTLDAGFFLGTGTAPQPRGLFNVAGIGDVPIGGPLVGLAPFIEAFAALEDANLSASAVFMHPSAWAVLMGVPEATGSNTPLLAASGGVGAGVQRSLLGVPVYVSSQLPLDRIGVAQADQVIAVRRQEARVDSTDATLFQEDMTAIRCITRWDIVLPNVKAFCQLSGITDVVAHGSAAGPAEAPAEKASKK